MTKQSRILIIGGGPSGLSLAVELKRYGFENVRIVEKLETLTTRGRALAIIPKTLTYLEASGSTELILEKAIKLKQVELLKDGKRKQIAITDIHPTYNHLTTLEQEDIEECLIQRLGHFGGVVERGVELSALNAKDRIAVLKKSGEMEEAPYDLLIGADGVGSTVRQLMQFEFKGSEEPEKWEQMEIAVPEKDNATIKLFLDKSPFMAAIPAPGNKYRVVTPEEGVEEKYAKVAANYQEIGELNVLWKSHFRVGYRMSEEMFEPNIALIGDAANVHSPVGGRGMNKGIEDAVLLADALNRNEDLNVWEKKRKHIDRALVRRIRFASWMIQQGGGIGKIVRTLIWHSTGLFQAFLRMIAR
jgi:2-polyprenyl-6-methoxyphenol hydroxylase-like FAD-dependent oxidoreductase